MHDPSDPTNKYPTREDLYGYYVEANENETTRVNCTMPAGQPMPANQPPPSREDLYGITITVTDTPDPEQPKPSEG